MRNLGGAMISVDEARSIVLSHTLPMGLEKVDLLTSLGRVIGEEIIAPFNIPPWDNSAMDGYAVRFEDIKKANPRLLKYLTQNNFIFIKVPLLLLRILLFQLR